MATAVSNRERWPFQPKPGGQSNPIASQKAGFIDRFRMDPDTPTSHSSKETARKQHDSVNSNLDPKLDTAKTCRDASEFVSPSSLRHAHSGQPRTNKKRSINRTINSNGASKKKAKPSSIHRMSRSDELSEDQSDDQGYGSEIKETEFDALKNPVAMNNSKPGYFIHSKLINSGRRHSIETYVRDGPTHQPQSSDNQSLEHPFNRPQSAVKHVRFSDSAPQKVTPEATQDMGIEFGQGKSPSPQYSSEDGDLSDAELLEDDTSQIEFDEVLVMLNQVMADIGCQLAKL